MRLKAYIQGFIKYKPLLIEFVERDLKTRYRRSVLGVFWTLLNPLLTMTVMTFVFSNLFKSNVPNFPVYLLAAQTILLFFSEATTTAMNSIIMGSSLIKKIYIPKYLFPLSKILSTLVNLGASFLALVIVMIFTGVKIKLTLVLAILPMIYISLFAFGIGLILSSIAMFFRDTIHLYGIILVLLTYMTPLFYPLEILKGTTLRVIEMNPLTSIVEYMRLVTLYGAIPPFELNIICLIPGVMSLVIGLWVFYNTQDKFILHM